MEISLHITIKILLGGLNQGRVICIVVVLLFIVPISCLSAPDDNAAVWPRVDIVVGAWTIVKIVRV